MGDIRLHDIDAERRLLSYLVAANNHDRAKTASLLRAENFFSPAHQIVFGTVADMIRSGVAIDWTTLAHRIKAAGQVEKVGGREGFQALRDAPPTDAPAEYAQAILNDYARRRVIEESLRLREMAAAGADAATILTHSRTVFQSIGTTNVCNTACTCSELFVQTVDRIEDYTNNSQSSYIKTGISALDRLTGGFGPGEFVTIAGRPGKGKTGLALTMAYNQAARGVKVLFLSLEMTDLPKLGMRLVSRLTGINSLRMKQPGGIVSADWEKIVDAGERISALPITWDTGGTKRIEEIERIIELSVEQAQTKIVYVDQLSKIRAHGDVFQRAAEATNRLSVLAANTKIPIVLLAQINREFEKTASKYPKLSHFKNTGAFEEDSAICLLLNRPEIEDIDAGREAPDTVWLSLAKNRDGAAANIDSLRFDPKRVVFYDADVSDQGRPATIHPPAKPPEAVPPPPAPDPPAIDHKTLAAGGEQCSLL